MKNFKGFDDWVEVFRGGNQIDSAGVEHDGNGLIDKAIATFDPGVHEPPVVVGHPKDNGPAFGWVEKLKGEVKNGKRVLMAKFKQVVPEFSNCVQKGLYKKRSAGFYPDGRLRHVGFLGAAPPAVKGLADLRFEEDDGAIIFVETHSRASLPGEQTTLKKGGENMDKFKEFMEFLQFWKKLEKDPDMGFGNDPTFSEADLDAAKKEAAEAERKKVEKEFTEKGRESAKSARDKEISDWVDARVKEGSLLPAWADSGLAQFMHGLDSETEIQFSEGENGKKASLAWMKDFLESFSKSPIFKEYAVKAKAGESAEFAEAKKDAEMGKSIAAKVNPRKE